MDIGTAIVVSALLWSGTTLARAALSWLHKQRSIQYAETLGEQVAAAIQAYQEGAPPDISDRGPYGGPVAPRRPRPTVDREPE